jgi:hypothetical protein
VVSTERIVTIHSTGPPHMVQTISDELGRVGYDAITSNHFRPKGLPAAYWLIEVGAQETINGFFLALGAAGFNKLVRTVFESGDDADETHLEVVDKDETRLALSSVLPDEALIALRDMDWSTVRGTSLTWSTDCQEWKSSG